MRSLLLLSLSLTSTFGAVCDVTSYGAKNDASARATQAIRAAVQACSKQGGGTVYFPPGKYETGAIELANDITLNIDAGATLHFHTDLSEYPLVPGRMEGTEMLTPAPLIGGRNLHNIAITGRGTLTTENAAWVKQATNPEARAMLNNIIDRLERREQVPEADFRKAAPALRPSFIRPMDSKNILIEGIHIVGSSFWTIHLLYDENVMIRNVVAETFPGSNTDGVDVDSSREVRISDSYFDTGDDGIVLKSGKGVDGRRVGKPTENVTITNCTVAHAHGAVVIGSETAGGVRNVAASNIVSKGTEIGIRVKSGRSRGGTIENLRFDNWIIDSPLKTGIIVTNYYVIIPEEPVSERTPVFRNIAISNVTVSGAPVVVDIQGLPEMPISGLHIRDLVGSGKAGLRAFNTKGMELRDIRLAPSTGPAFLIRDSSDTQLDRLSSDTPGLTMRLDRVKGAAVEAVRGEVSGLKGEASPSDYWQSINSPDKAK